MQKTVQQKKKKKNTLKNVQQKDTEKCTKKYTDKKFSRFFWSFVGSRKAEKIREKFPGGKKESVKKYWFFSRKKPEKFTGKVAGKKILPIFLHFSLFFWTTKKKNQTNVQIFS